MMLPKNQKFRNRTQIYYRDKIIFIFKNNKKPKIETLKITIKNLSCKKSRPRKMMASAMKIKQKYSLKEPFQIRGSPQINPQPIHNLQLEKSEHQHHY